MQPVWAWYEADNVTPNATISFAAVNGTPGTPIERHLFNDFAGAEAASDSEDFLLTVVTRPAGVGDYTMEDDLAANGWVEVRLTGSGGTGMVNQTTGWTRLGRGRYLRVRGIKGAGWRGFEIRDNVPFGAGVLAKDVKFRVIEGLRAFALEFGHTEGGAQGLRMGLGDASFTEILSGFEMTEAGTPDNTVLVAKGREVFAGVPAAELDSILTFSNLDVASAALAAAEEYLALITRDGAGGFVATKTAKGTAPLAETLLPAIPAGHRALGWVRVPFSAVIANAEITSTVVYGGAALVGTTLAPVIHPFEALIGNAMIIIPSSIPLTLVDADVNYVWISPSGGVATNVTGIQPEDMSQLAYEVTTAAGVITLVMDCRQWVYPCPVNVTLYRQGTLAAAQVFYGVLPSMASAYLLPIGGITASVGDRGATSGATLFDVYSTDRNNTYVTLFTGSGTHDERPSIAFDAAHPVDMDAMPEVCFFHGGTRFKAEVVSIPGTASVDATLTLRMSAVGAA